MSTTPEAPSIAQFLKEGRETLLRRSPLAQPAREWIAEYTNLVDATLRRIYLAAWETVRGEHPEWHQDRAQSEAGADLSLLAIGGYGRAEMVPFSDIDIAFLPSEEEHPVIDAVVKEAFRLIVEVFIDSARLEVGYAYRPVADVERLDNTGKAALLEARLIAGSEKLPRRLREELHARWDPVEFLLEKAAERRAAAGRLDLSLYAIEPHLKEGTGGLRDIQTALWVAGAVLKTNQPIKALEYHGIVTGDDCAQVMAAYEFLLKTRVWLHLVTGKKTDVLRIEFQDRAARAFHFTGAGGRAVQKFLATYYGHAEIASRFSNKVMRRLLEGPLPLDDHFVATHRRLQAAHPYTLRNHPELLLTPFALARKYGFDFAPELERSIEEALPRLNEQTRRQGVARAAFFSLLQNVGTAADAMAELRARGLLQKFIPEFEDMLHLAPGDPSHQLAVGEHSIFAVRKLGELWEERRNNDSLWAVWDGVDDMQILVLGTLLHDVGKIERGTDHSVSGERIAREIGVRLGLTNDRTELLALLVRRHLLLPRMARLRELSEPGTIREVITHARDVPTLKMLYLLSLADTCAVGERSYSKLDLEAMQELYERTLLAMTREETAAVLTDMEQREQLVQRERERLRRELRHLELDEATLHRISEDLPAAYVLNTPLPTIATHLKFLDELPQEKLIVDFYDPPRGGFTELTLVTYDDPQPGLLSKLCGVVHAAGSDILAAHVYTLRARNLPPDAKFVHPEGRDIVLDRLNVTSNGRPLSESRSARLAALLREVLLGHKSVEEVLKAAGKATCEELAPERISARNDLSDEHTVITVVNENLPGLLYHITRGFSAVGLDIHTAKITVWGGRAENSFYVTRRAEDGPGFKLPDEEIKDVLDMLRVKLQRPEL
jgi:[protein-PII] uridylyltransferase